MGEKPEPGSLWAVEEAGGQEAKAEGNVQGNAEDACMKAQTVNEECCGSKAVGIKAAEIKAPGAEKSRLPIRDGAFFAIVILIMMTLQPLFGSVLWNIWYDLR